MGVEPSQSRAARHSPNPKHTLNHPQRNHSEPSTDVSITSFRSNQEPNHEPIGNQKPNANTVTITPKRSRRQRAVSSQNKY